MEDSAIRVHFLTALTFSGPARSRPRRGAQEREALGERLPELRLLGDWFREMGEGPGRPSAAFSGARPPFKWTGKIAGEDLRGAGYQRQDAGDHGKRPEVELVAIRSGRRNDPESVKIEVVRTRAASRSGAGLLEPRRGPGPNECTPGGGHTNTRKQRRERGSSEWT